MKVIYSEETRLPPFLCSIVWHLSPFTCGRNGKYGGNGWGVGEREMVTMGRLRPGGVAHLARETETRGERAACAVACLSRMAGWPPSRRRTAGDNYRNLRKKAITGCRRRLSPFGAADCTTSRRCATYDSHTQRTHPITSAFPDSRSGSTLPD